MNNMGEVIRNMSIGKFITGKNSIQRNVPEKVIKGLRVIGGRAYAFISGLVLNEFEATE